jgi:hypothetical protein
MSSFTVNVLVVERRWDTVTVHNIDSAQAAVHEVIRRGHDGDLNLRNVEVIEDYFDEIEVEGFQHALFCVHCGIRIDPLNWSAPAEGYVDDTGSKVCLPDPSWPGHVQPGHVQRHEPIRGILPDPVADDERDPDARNFCPNCGELTNPEGQRK